MKGKNKRTQSRLMRLIEVVFFERYNAVSVR